MKKKKRWRKGLGHKMEKLLMIIKYRKGRWIADEKMRKLGVNSKDERDYLKQEIDCIWSCFSIVTSIYISIYKGVLILQSGI